MNCCGFGHRELYFDISADLDDAIAQAVRSGVTTFFTGGMGDFDRLFSAAVRKVRRKNPAIKLILVRPYFSNELNINKNYYETNFDDVVIPIELAGIHYKAAIKARNRWMVDQSDIVTSGVYRNFGGACEAIRHAKKQGKAVIEAVKNKELPTKTEGGSMRTQDCTEGQEK